MQHLFLFWRDATVYSIMKDKFSAFAAFAALQMCFAVQAISGRLKFLHWDVQLCRDYKGERGGMD